MLHQARLRLTVALVPWALLALGLMLGAVAQAGPTVNANTVVFSPDSVNVNEGDFVLWDDLDTDGAAHTVTASASQVETFNYDLPNGGTVQHTFNNVATISYLCNIHPGMDGTVTVGNIQPSIAYTTAPATGASVSAPFGVSGTASDPGGISKVELSQDNGATWTEVGVANGVWSGTVDPSGLAHGAQVQVRARVTDGEGSTRDTETRTYLVNALPAPSFTFTPAAPTSADTLQFNSTSTDDHTIGALSWDFGDGTTGTGAIAAHRLAKGARSVALTAVDDHGLSATATRSITVANGAPRANFSATPADPVFNETVSFTDRTDDIDGDATAWAWDFGDGGTSALRNATHVFAAPGTYTVKLTVTDAEGASNVFQRGLVVEEFSTQRPVAQLSAVPLRGMAPFTPTFTLDGFDPDGTVSNWTLDFGDGSARLTGPGSLFAGAGSHQQAHTYQRNGTFEAVLTLRDDLGATGTNRTLIVVDPPPNRPPSVRFEVAPTATPRKGQLLTFVDGSTDLDFEDRPDSWDWDFGDGSRTCCKNRTVTHAYTQAGRFEVKLTVKDTLGAASTVPLVVEVQGQPPAASLEANATQGRAPFPVAFTVKARDDDGRVESWELSFGDGSPPERGTTAPTNVTVRHVYENAGSFSAQLEVVDDDDLSRRIVLAIATSARAPDALPLPPGAISIAPTPARFTYRFAATTSMPGDIVYHWAFGDGRTAIGKEVEYSYDQAGAYTVTLTLQNPQGVALARASTGLGVGEDASTAASHVRAAVASGTLRVAWDPDARAAGYQVWKATAAGSFALLTNVTGTTHFDDDAVEDGKAYTYQVTFFSADGSGRMRRLSELSSTDAFRRIGQVQATGLVDSDGDGVGDTRDAFPLDSTRTVAAPDLLLPILGLALVAGAGVAVWKYQAPLKARLARGPEPGALVTVPGLQPQHALVLIKAGIQNTRMLAVADPVDLAKRTVITKPVLEHWVAVAQLLQLPGIPPDDAAALAGAGIRGPWDLARADPSALSQRIREVPLAKVQRWVRTARRATSAS